MHFAFIHGANTSAARPNMNFSAPIVVAEFHQMFLCCAQALRIRFLSPSPTTCSSFDRLPIANRSNLSLTVAYRTSPEHPYPLRTLAFTPRCPGYFYRAISVPDWISLVFQFQTKCNWPAKMDSEETVINSPKIIKFLPGMKSYFSKLSYHFF
jgi:hypothetical protein